MNQVLIFIGGALVFYWMWGMSKGRERPFIFDGVGGVVVLLAGLGVLVAGLVL